MQRPNHGVRIRRVDAAPQPPPARDELLLRSGRVLGHDVLELRDEHDDWRAVQRRSGAADRRRARL